MQAIIHINDNRLVIQREAKHFVYKGYAWLRGEEVTFDFSDESNAVQNCRLEPQQVNSHYWQQCDQNSIPQNQAGMRHSADLVWQHLTAMKTHHQFEEVIFVVPSHYQNANLQLLVGIAEAVGLKVVAIINKAVLLASQAESQLQRHIDVQLHQSVVSEFIYQGSEVTLGEVEVLHEVGLNNLQDAVLREIQQRFISADRFDPLHYAETEQQLFNALPAILEAAVLEGKANVAVNYAGRQYGVSMNRDQLLAGTAKLMARVQSLAAQEGASLEATRIDFNGLNFFDAARQCESPLMPWDKMLALMGPNSQQGLHYRTSLACSSEKLPRSSDIEQAVIPSSQRKQEGVDPHLVLATHLVKDGIAFPIAEANIQFSDSTIKLSFGPPNVQSLLSENKLSILGRGERMEIVANDRLTSDLADGVITSIAVSSN